MNAFWTLWFLVCIGLFAAGEGYALQYRKKTLSRFIWDGFVAWPLTAAVLGMLFGGLLVHFFWHWCPVENPINLGTYYNG